MNAGKTTRLQAPQKRWKNGRSSTGFSFQKSGQFKSLKIIQFKKNKKFKNCKRASKNKPETID